MTENYQPKIKLFKTRSFGEKINATFDFLKENFKPLFKIIAIINIPMVAFMSLGVTMASTTMLNNLGSPDQTIESPTFWSGYGIVVVIGVILACTFYAINYRYLKLYQKYPPAEITVGKILKPLLSDSAMLLAGLIFFGIITVIGMMFFLLPGIFLFVAFSMMFVIMIFEDVNLVQAMSRSLKLIRGKWWSTFGILVVVWIIQFAITMVFTMPTYILSALQLVYVNENPETFNFSSTDMILQTALTFISYTGSTLTSTIGAVAISFQYFNLREKQEAFGLMADVRNYNVEQES